MPTILERLTALHDKKYAAFQAKLTPTVAPELFIGVRVPQVRKLAKELAGTPEAAAFIQKLPHKYYDENMLHGLLLAEIKDYPTCLKEVNRFLPYVDNWAVCDIMSPKIFKKHKEELLAEIKKWAASKETYTCRFGLEMLMSHFLDASFQAAYLQIPAAVNSTEYYVNMMIAWFFATALAKQWPAAIPYLAEKRLKTEVHKKTIRKACESYRLTAEQKTYLKSLL